MNPIPLLTIVSRSQGWHTQQLLDAAKRQNIPTQVLSGSAESVENEIGRLSHGIILWRSSRLSSKKRTDVLRKAHTRGCRVINQTLFLTPEIRSKQFQYEKALEAKRIFPIPTHTFSTKSALLAACDDGSISFPAIAKPRIGSQGKGVLFFASRKDIEKIPGEEIPNLLFQPFIKNTGDYRIFMVGGVPLGVMKRIGKEGEYRNNISQGGHGEIVTDANEYKEVIELAIRVVTLFKLQICGVDLIRDAGTGKLYFLEVNTVPEWGEGGFEQTTGIAVGEKIIDYVTALLAADTQPFHKTIQSWYDTHVALSPKTAFHWWSRRYLWSRDAAAKEALIPYRSFLFGKTNTPTDFFSSILRLPETEGAGLHPLRREVLKCYPDLLHIQSVLIKTLFAETVYGEDIRTAALTAIGQDRVRKLWNQLHQEKHDLTVLSTYAVNTLSFIDLLFGKTLKLHLDPSLFLEAFRLGIQNQNIYRARETLYLATHAIIGASAFYDRPILQHRDIYQTMIEEAQAYLEQQKNNVPLDVQIEFVVATHLFGKSSYLEKEILARTKKSTDPYGVFVTDPKNSQGGNFLKAEHRNVLYWMAQTPWHRT